MSIWCVLQIVDRISRFAAEMPSMLSCRIRRQDQCLERHACSLVVEIVARIRFRIWRAVWIFSSPGEPGYLRGM